MERWLASTTAGKILRAQDMQDGKGPTALLTRPRGGVRISQETAEGLTAAAVIEHGAWIIRCPLPGCAGAEYGDPETPLFRCHSCWNALAEGRLIRVFYPGNLPHLEASLLERSDGRLRSWSPPETAASIARRTRELGLLFGENPNWFDGRFPGRILNHTGLRALGMVTGEHSWVTPPTRATGDVITAAIWNQDVRDNPRFLKGLDGAVQFSDGLDVQANEILFGDVAGSPATAGFLQRNGANLEFHDGTAARVLANGNNTLTMANKTLTAPVINGTVTGTGTMALAGQQATEATTTATAEVDIATATVSIAQGVGFKVVALLRVVTGGGATGAQVGIKLNATVVLTGLTFAADVGTANVVLVAEFGPEVTNYNRAGVVIVGDTGGSTVQHQAASASIGATITSVIIRGNLLGSPSGGDLMGVDEVRVYAYPTA